MRPWGFHTWPGPEFDVTISPNSRSSLFSKTLPEPSNPLIYDIFGDSKYKNVLHVYKNVSGDGQTLRGDASLGLLLVHGPESEG